MLQGPLDEGGGGMVMVSPPPPCGCGVGGGVTVLPSPLWAGVGWELCLPNGIDKWFACVAPGIPHCTILPHLAAPRCCRTLPSRARQRFLLVSL